MNLFTKQKKETTDIIPKQFIRIWLGPKKIPDLFEKWWTGFQNIHPDYKFITIVDEDSKKAFNEIYSSREQRHRFIDADSFWETKNTLYYHLQSIYKESKTYAGLSDILRIVALYELGGIYLDTDMMPIKSFDKLLEDNTPFACKRSSKSFESAVLGGPAKHTAFINLINAIEPWYEMHKEKVMIFAGAFISSEWFGNPDIRHLPIKTFYPYNGFMAPKRHEKEKIFENISNFPKEMIAAHFSNHIWGGKPKGKI
tara:strand:+ start:1213 stop:1977 length:765 start_codon:yes stop_codon:yes gene_type:complete